MRQMSAPIVLILAGTILAIGQSDQQRPEAKKPPITKESALGTWKGNLEDIPAVEINLKLDADHLAGTAVFYVVDPGASEVVEGKKEQGELIDARLDGATLTFKIKRSDGKIVRFEMKLASEEEAILKPVEDRGSGEEMSITMRKVK